jgi:hypothetical protein
MVLRTVRWELDLERGSQWHLKLSQLKRDHQAQVHPDQMVLVMVRQEAGSHDRRPKAPKGELENISRNPRDLVRKLA